MVAKWWVSWLHAQLEDAVPRDSTRGGHHRNVTEPETDEKSPLPRQAQFFRLPDELPELERIDGGR